MVLLHMATDLYYAVAVGRCAGTRIAGAAPPRLQKVSITLLHNLCNCVINKNSKDERKMLKMQEILKLGVKE